MDTTRATYFAGKAAMMVWSPFLLDELAGLRNDALPTCPQCKTDPAFLAKNSGIVTAIKGPNGTEPAQFGEISSWAVHDGADADPAKSFVEYMMCDGYQRWFGMAPEGKFPVRTGTAGRPGEVPRPPGTPARPAWTPRSRSPTSTATRCSTTLRTQPGHLPALGPHPGPGRAGRRHARRAAGAQGAGRR